MEYTVDFDVHKFEFWSGAKDRTGDLTYDQMTALGEYIEECLGDRETPPTETEINDFVWFDCDDYLAELTGEDDEDEPEDDEEEDSDE